VPDVLVDIIGFTAFVLNVSGNLMLAWKSRWGWLVRIAAIICWGAYAVSIASWPMIANSVTFFAINCVGFYRWQKEARWWETQRRSA